MTGYEISGTATGWISLEIPVMLLAGFYWEVNPMAGHGISSNGTGWISLGSKSHAWTWNFQ